MSSTKKSKSQKKGEVRTQAWFQKEIDEAIQELEKEEEIEKREAKEEESEEEEEEEEEEEKEQKDLADLSFVPLDSKKGDQEGSTVLYIGHLPFGFEEFQVADYFQQFGEVKRSFIARSKKSGNSKGYGFVEFEYSQSAQIAADVMDDYLIFKKRLKCMLVPKIAASKIKWPQVKEKEARSNLYSAQRKFAAQYNARNSVLPLNRLVEREERKKTKLQKLGINYEFDGYAALVNKLKQNTERMKRKREEEEQKQKQEKEGEEEDNEEEMWNLRKKAKEAGELTALQKSKKLTAELRAKRKQMEAANGTSKTTPKIVQSTPVGKEEGEGEEQEEETTDNSVAAPTNTPAKNTTTPKKGEKTETPKKVNTPKHTPAKQVATTPKTPSSAKKLATPQSKKKKISG